MRGFLGLLFCASVSAQFVQSVQVYPPLPKPDLIVTGTLLNGVSRTVEPRFVIEGAIRVDRPIQGNVRSGDLIPVHWEFMINPMHGPSGKPPEGPALWFLSGRSGTREPMHLGNEFGGYFSIPIPGPLPDVFLYKPDAPLEEKLAAEMAFAMEQAAASAGRLLNVQRTHQGNATVIQSNPTASEFGKLLDIWTHLTREYRSPYIERFAASPAPALRAIAVGDMLARGDPEGIAILQREAAVLSPTTTADEIAVGLRRMQQLPSLETLHALGRIALGETGLPGMELSVLLLLGQVRSVEMLPYLAAMLESPEQDVQRIAGLGFCHTLSPPPEGGAAPYWTPAMADKCQAALSWKQWWNGPRKEIPELASLPDIQPPARYRQ